MNEKELYNLGMVKIIERNTRGMKDRVMIEHILDRLKEKGDI